MTEDITDLIADLRDAVTRKGTRSNWDIEGLREDNKKIADAQTALLRHKEKQQAKITQLRTGYALAKQYEAQREEILLAEIARLKAQIATLEHTCKTCQFWNGHIYADGQTLDGPCELIDKDNGSAIRSGIAHIDVNTSYLEFIDSIYLNTPAEFGCTQWQPVPQIWKEG